MLSFQPLCLFILLWIIVFVGLSPAVLCLMFLTLFLTSIYVSRVLFCGSQIHLTKRSKHPSIVICRYRRSLLSNVPGNGSVMTQVFQTNVDRNLSAYLRWPPRPRDSCCRTPGFYPLLPFLRSLLAAAGLSGRSSSTPPSASSWPGHSSCRTDPLECHSARKDSG